MDDPQEPDIVGHRARQPRIQEGKGLVYGRLSGFDVGGADLLPRLCVVAAILPGSTETAIRRGNGDRVTAHFAILCFHRVER